MLTCVIIGTEQQKQSREAQLLVGLWFSKHIKRLLTFADVERSDSQTLVGFKSVFEKNVETYKVLGRQFSILACYSMFIEMHKGPSVTNKFKVKSVFNFRL